MIVPHEVISPLRLWTGSLAENVKAVLVSAVQSHPHFIEMYYFLDGAGRPRIVPPEINVSTGINGLCQQIVWIERFVIFQHGPGNHQHFGCDLYAGLCLDSSLPLAAFQHAVVDTAEGIIVIGGD